MIPTSSEARQLWDTYTLPTAKRNHCALVAGLAVWLGNRLTQKTAIHINLSLLEAAGLLHDIDKAVPRKTGERHPDTAVRLLREQAFTEVADLVRTHPLHAILDHNLSPKSWEEKLLYLSDKMVKHAIISVDERFALWNAEHLPQKAQDELDAAYPKVKALEAEVCTKIGLSPADIIRLASSEISGTMK